MAGCCFFVHECFVSVALGETPGQATAQRIAQQELEAQAREDEQLALRLTALEEASHLEREGRRAARRRLRQDSNAFSPPRAGSVFAVSHSPTAAAVAAEGVVSEAVRVLQFQDIDENDFEVLLGLDEDGGAGGRCCAGGKGLTEKAMEEVLQRGLVSEDRLSERCAICMTDYELNEEVSVVFAWFGFGLEFRFSIWVLGLLGVFVGLVFCWVGFGQVSVWSGCGEGERKRCCVFKHSNTGSLQAILFLAGMLGSFSPLLPILSMCLSQLVDPASLGTNEKQ